MAGVKTVTRTAANLPSPLAAAVMGADDRTVDPGWGGRPAPGPGRGKPPPAAQQTLDLSSDTLPSHLIIDWQTAGAPQTTQQYTTQVSSKVALLRQVGSGAAGTSCSIVAL